MGLWFAFGALAIGWLWLLSAQPVHSRGDTFQVAPTPSHELEEQENPRNDILDINQGPIPSEAPEKSFLLESDIIKGSPFRSISSTNPRWPKKKGIVQIPYIISYKYDKLSVKIIKEAFEDFAKFTCIKFVPYSYQRDFISIAPLSGCFSSAGRIGGMQVVFLAPGCLKRGKGVALHELMHVLGFWHEHSRADQGKYISISWNEILTGFEINFIKSWNTNMLEDNGYSSVMHYERNVFSMTDLPTIIPVSSPSAFLGQRWNLSISDIARINKLYKCSQVAAQPEVATEEAIKEKIRDIIPVQPEPSSAENNLARSPNSSIFVRETTEPILLPQRTVGEGLSTIAGHIGRTEMSEQSMVVSTKTSHTGEASRELQMTSKHVLDTTQTRQMETNAIGSVVENSSAPWPAQNPTTGWQLNNPFPSYSKAYIPIGQSPTETRTRAAPEMEQTSSSQTKGPALSSVETIHGATIKLGQKETGVHVSGARATVLEPTVELPTAVELASSLVMGSSETKDGMGSPSSSAHDHVSVVEKQPKEPLKEAFHQSVTVSINETGSPAYIQPMEEVLTNMSNSLYIFSTLRNPTTTSSHVELGEKAQLTEEEGLAKIATIPGPSGREEEAESPYYKNATVRTYTPSPSSKYIHTAHKHGGTLLPGKETSVPETTGAPSSPQGVFTGPPAGSKLKEVGSLYNSSTGYSVMIESFSLLPPHQAGNDYEWGTSVTHKPPRSVSLHGTEQPTEPEKHTLDHAELTSQIPTWGEVASLAIKTNMAAPSTEQSSTTAGPGDDGSWSQTSSDKPHSRIVTVGGSPPADVERQTFEKTIETASIPTIERLPITRKIEVSHRERHRRTTLKRPSPIEPSGSHVSTQPEQGGEETQGQRSSTFSIITGVQNHEIQTSDSNGLRAVVSPKHCGGKLAMCVTERLSTHTEHTTKRLSSLDRQLKWGITGNRSPRPEIQEYGPTSRRIFLLGKERNTSPRNLGGSMKRGGKNETSNFVEHLKEATLSVKTNEFMQTTPKKRNPEITVVSATRAAEPQTLGSSIFFTILAHSKPTLKRFQSHFSWGGMESVTRSGSMSARSRELTTETKISPQLKESLPSAEGRSVEPANSTKALTTDWMSWITAHVQEGTTGRHSTRPLSLEMQPTTLEGKASLPITGSLPSPKLVNHTEGSIGSHIRMDTSPLPRKEFPVGTTVVLSTYLSNAIILDSRENQAIIRTDAKQAKGSTSKASGEMQLETPGSTLASTEICGIPQVGVSTMGSHEEQTKLPQLQSELQTRIAPVRGVGGPPSDEKASTLFLEEKWKSFTKENETCRSVEPAAAKPTEIGSKGSEQSSIYTTGATSLSVESLSPLISANSTEKTEEPTLFDEKTWNVQSSLGPSSQQYSAAFTPPRPGTATPQVVPFVPDVYNSHSTEKMETADMSQRVTELSKRASVPAGISLPHLQTLGSAEMERSSSMIYGVKGLEEATHTRMRQRELFPLATESSRQVSEIQIAMKLAETTRSHKKERKLEENKAFLASNPIYLHHINKRSLPGIMVTPPSFVVSFPAPICKLLQSNIGQVSPRKLNIMKLFPKKHMHKIIMASSGGTTQQRPPPGCLDGYLSHPAIGQDVALSVENMTRAGEPEKPILRSTSKSKSLALLQKLSPSVKKGGNNQGPNQRTTDHTSIFCSFKENLCGWTQSKNDSLDWILDKEEQQSAESMEDRSISGMPFRSLDGYISLKPSSHLPDQKAVLISPIVHGIRCLQFWYSPMDSAAGEINFYIKLQNSTEWQSVWSMKGKQDIGWHQMTINISRIWTLQAALEGIVGTEVRRKARIDDLVLCRKPCGQCLQYL